ncbi:undecaprenyl-phosphate galactose phosphotransferase WbaP [Meiothermus taiwanensis]|uniref:Undecaprenyl-phosphate galactose phosphotransferase, WbaP n=2 Tax=Meiothermus taiwanensis TaxID=172827 RepID=A0ABN5LZM0_9DEIN|nr:undecaprenyl-phosphate galactose phosphotransferase WbaP [Meiothermus taiwanensis]AWR86212.1 Undecaprenyl-phosphate galactose phosphotransferase, WbaP [Meiothermus taiwanensis WR-220]KIQ55900.1 UDP-phosphate galactose phosphotransferase [Meiothermus taiwanensis]KZK14909.1 UDP-phosphate galactose phosphotransferase [Meiothermus taiwanensis]
MLLSIWLRYLWDRSLIWDLYLDLWPALLLFPLAYALAGLYGVGIAPPEELRRLSYSTSLVFVVLGAATFMYKAGADYSRGAFVFAWGLALVLVPLGRALVRELFARKPWWGAAVLVLGAGKTGEEVVRALQKQPGLGLKPIALLDDDPAKQGREIGGVPVLGGLERAWEFAQMGVQHAIIAMPGVPRDRLLQLLEAHGGTFPHLILIPDLFGFSSLWLTTRDLGGVLGLELRQRLLLPGPRLVKRVIDIALVIAFALPVALLLAIIGLLIRLDSPGSVFYGQWRVGLSGNRFRAWKFRSMVRDADRLLAEYLQRHPELKAEWEHDQKLKNDPRVTRVGRFLRKTSLDELPQLWNVLKGEMSLVGPRPIVDEEIKRYGSHFSLYAKVRPGLTGLWQVSGRNDTTYAERVAMDVYYVRNWSPWLDLYILARTVWVVLFGKGAY